MEPVEFTVIDRRISPSFSENLRREICSDPIPFHPTRISYPRSVDVCWRGINFAAAADPFLLLLLLNQGWEILSQAKIAAEKAREGAFFFFALFGLLP